MEGLDGYDLTFIGFPIMAFGPAQPARDCMVKYAAGKEVALFVTHAAPEGEAALEEWLTSCPDTATCAESVAFFHCQGEPAEPVAEALLKSDNVMLRAFGERRPGTVGQPDESRLAGFRALPYPLSPAAGAAFFLLREAFFLPMIWSTKTFTSSWNMSMGRWRLSITSPMRMRVGRPLRFISSRRR